MRLLTLSPALAAFLAFAACGGPQPVEEPEQQAYTPPSNPFAAKVAEAHGLETWRSKDALQADITVEFGENPPMNAQVVFETKGPGARLTMNGGPTVVFDGETAWLSPADAELQRARFHVKTWPYFIAAPFKLDDPGVELEDRGMMPLTSEDEYEAQRMTFAAGVGDTPDDWYYVYVDPESGVLQGLAYIVTYGATTEEAEEEPHAIRYETFTEVEGVQIPAVGTFWNWSEDEGITGEEPIGRLTVRNPLFVSPPDGAFDKPADAVEATLPQ